MTEDVKNSENRKLPKQTKSVVIVHSTAYGLFQDYLSEFDFVKSKKHFLTNLSFCLLGDIKFSFYMRCFLTVLNGIKYQFQSVETIRRNVILLFVRKKVFLNEPIVTLSENILLEIRRQHTRRARKHVLLEFLCKQSKSSL